MCLIGLFASAQVRAEPSAAERETARGLLAEGDRLHAAGDLKGALSCYKSAHAIIRIPTTGLDVAEVAAELGLLVEARSAAMEAANLPATAGEPGVFAKARTDARALAKSIEPRVPSVKTLVTPTDAPYSLTIDGISLPTEARAVAFRTNPGEHVVRVEAAGYEPIKVNVELLEGQAFSHTLALKPLPAPPAPAPPYVAPHYPLQPPPRRVSMSAADAEAVSDARLRGIIGLSVGGAVLIGGAVVGSVSLVQAEAIEVDCANGHCPKNKRADISSANTLANVANVLMPLGLLGAAYGAFELLTARSRKGSQPDSLNASLTVDWTGTGITVRGAL